MKCGLLVFAAAALSSSPVLAQSVYVAPGGVYIASARVIVAPGSGAPYVAPDATYNGSGYAPPAVYDGAGYGAGYAAPAAYGDPGYAAPAPAYYGNPGYQPPAYGPPGYTASAQAYGPGYAPAPAYSGHGYPPPAAAYGGYPPPGHGYGAPGYGAPGYGAPRYGAPGYGPPGYAAPGYAAPGGPPLATRASYGRPAVYTERRLTNVNAYAAEGPPRPPAAIPRGGVTRCVVNLGNGRWAACN
jgi:hypothetical protein